MPSHSFNPRAKHEVWHLHVFTEQSSEAWRVRLLGGNVTAPGKQKTVRMAGTQGRAEGAGGNSQGC